MGSRLIRTQAVAPTTELVACRAGTPTGDRSQQLRFSYLVPRAGPACAGSEPTSPVSPEADRGRLDRHPGGREKLKRDTQGHLNGSNQEQSGPRR